MTDGRVQPDIDAWLRRNREPLLRQWATLVVERSTLDELAVRPLSDWIHALEARLDAGGRDASPVEGAGAANGDRAPDEDVESFATARDREAEAEAEIERQVASHRGAHRPLAVALVGAPGDPASERSEDPGPAAWSAALREARGERGPEVVRAGHGATAVILPRTGPLGARAAVDRLRVRAWELLGERGPLADAGLAVYPDDGATAADVLAAARDRLRRAWESPLGLNGG